MKQLNFLVIGTNFISDNFCGAASKLDGVNVFGVYSRKSETGTAFARKYGIKNVYTELAAALSEKDINAVYVASPTFLHKEHSIMAMKAGKDVLCEKSIALSSQELSDMIKVAREEKRVLLEAMRPAFDPSLNIIKDSLSKIGRIRRASLDFCQYSSRYDNFKKGIVENAFNKDIGNSALSDIGVYPLWLAIELFGQPIRVDSVKKYLSGGFLGMGSSVLDYGDKYVSVTYSKITDSVCPSYIEGEEGSVIIDKITQPKSIVLALRKKDKITLPYTPCENNMVYEISAFKRMTEGEIDHLPYLETTEKVMRIADIIHKTE